MQQTFRMALLPPGFSCGTGLNGERHLVDAWRGRGLHTRSWHPPFAWRKDDTEQIRIPTS